MPSAKWQDERIENILGNLLRVGVMLSAAVVLVGAVFYLIRHGGERPNYGVFRGEPRDLRTIGGIVKDAFHWRGRAWIQLGLVLLIATPVARVAFSVFAFLREGDKTYVVVTLIVLTLLLYSILSGYL